MTQQFENCRISRYPSPNRCVFDKGGEFIGEAFQQMLMKYNVDTVGTTTKNDILRVIMRTTTIETCKQVAQDIDNTLTMASHALC